LIVDGEPDIQKYEFHFNYQTVKSIFFQLFLTIVLLSASLPFDYPCISIDSVEPLPNLY